jgi:hypothetical protein
MTLEEAKAYLSLSAEIDCIQDTYDEYLFDQKLFFRNKPVIKSVFLKQISKIEIARQAYEVLGLDCSFGNLNEISWEFTTNMLSNFHRFYEKKNSILQLIFNSRELNELLNYAQKLLELEISYASLWSNFDVKIEKKMTTDPMDVLADLKKLAAKKIENYTDYKPKEHEHLIHLNAEIARLSIVNR